MSAPAHKITSEEQLIQWLNGKSLHRHIDGVTGGECCPDFSCCKPELKATIEERRAFVVARRPMQEKFLTVFLGRLIQLEGRKDTKIAVIGSSVEKGE